MTLPIDPLAQPDPYTGTDGKLAEAGAGWRNDLIESAHVKAAMEPDVARDTDFVSGTDPELNRQWLASLKEQPTPGPCVNCQAETTRRIATDIVKVKGRNWGFHWLRECEGCGQRRAARKLRARIQSGELSAELVAKYQQEIVELEAV